MKPVILIIAVLLFSLLVSGQEDLVIDKVSFEGNSSISASRLRDQMIMESSSWFKEKILGKQPVLFTQSLYKEDIKRAKIFYQKEGFLDVEFSEPEILVNKKNKVEVTIHITENNPVTISEIRFEVDSAHQLNEVLKKREVRKIILQTKASEEKVFRDETMQRDKLVIAEVFYDSGYPYTKVTSDLNVDTLKKTTSIDWSIDRGPLSYFGKTSVSGNVRVPDKSILRQVNYKEGDVWSKKKIDQTQDLIYNQGNYRVASVRTQLGTSPSDTLPITVNIREAPRWSTRFGVGYGREDQFRTFADIQYLGFFTNTGRLNFYAKHSGLEPYNVYLKFSQPSFLFSFNTLTLYPYILRQNEPGYKLDKNGYSITFLQNFSEELSTSIGYIFEDVQLDTTNFAGIDNVPDEETYYRKSGLVFGFTYNNSEPILDPVQGLVVSFGTKTNDVIWKNEIPFVRMLADVRTYAGISKGIVLALKAKMGGIVRTDDNDFIPVEERFYAGGSYSVRGWSRSDLGPKDESGTPIGGNSLFEASAEFRFNVGRRLKFSVFTDAGNVWHDSFSYHFNDLHYSSGAGIYINTPIGPAGLDFARPVFDTESKWQIHFNIGHTF
ncbi:BamA/OMP85 family outer membrane protein [Maribellus sediminis]|uniref:BamA/OMP85 family outer membrane protein n=1 Tax=Maribellus sediminis TaxID=2696285 RepID=UPI001430EB61|nr:BamA/TamA family outer membrane protein [Maribellus sediminis]